LSLPLSWQKKNCDRVGIVVICCLSTYCLKRSKEESFLKTDLSFTTELARAITDAYNVELVEVLTGFKFIGEKIKQLDEFGDKKYLFGFEESYGYLAGTWLMELLEKYGYTLEGITSFTLKGKDGVEKICKIWRI